MLDVVGNPEDRFSCDAVHINVAHSKIVFISLIMKDCLGCNFYCIKLIGILRLCISNIVSKLCVYAQTFQYLSAFGEL